MSGWDSLIKGATPVNSKVDEDFIVSGLVERGLPEHIARGFAMNFGDESGFDAGINEVSPTVKGSRGGFGLAQWTGPRRRNLEAYAKSNGARVNDPEIQLDFLMKEIEGEERGSMKHVMATETPGAAGAAIVAKFLRPNEKSRRQRVAQYTAFDSESGTQTHAVDNAGAAEYTMSDGSAQQALGSNKLWLGLGE